MVLYMKHVVSFSGGLGSWMAAKRVAEKYGTDNLYLVFTDVLIEDEDLYRFLPEAAANVGGNFITITDGRDPWDVFHEKRYMGNTRTAHCSEELKSKPFYNWLDEQGWDDAVVYLGIDWTESHRLDNARKRRPDINYYAPLCEAPYLTRTDMIAELKKNNIELPRLYKMGFAHNNCGGGCVKAGQAQWAALLKEMPDRYKYFEDRQNKMMAEIPTARPFLRKTENGELKYLTLTRFKEMVRQEPQQVDAFDWGGCGCFVTEAP